jgi:2-hydroxy-3-keto-5-methylthiopentenyl-1-phosphate phosphatase
MALVGDVVFARDRLAEYLGDRDVAYHPWDDFHDIQKILATFWMLRLDPA